MRSVMQESIRPRILFGPTEPADRNLPASHGRSGLVRRLSLFRRHSPLLLGALLTAGLSFTLPAASPAGEVKTVDGVVRILNSDKPDDGAKTVQLEEVWRAGGEDDQEVLFGVIGQAMLGKDGNLYLLDTQLSEVHVFDMNGEFLKTLSREGEGPGEVRNPGDMFFTPENKLGLVQAMPGKVVMVNLDGTPGGMLQLSGNDPTQGSFAFLTTGACRGGNMVLGGISMTFGGGGVNHQTYFLSKYSLDGAEVHRYLDKEYTINFAEFDMDEAGIDFVWAGRYSVLEDGRVCAAPERNRYEINVYNPDGSVDRVIERKYESRKRDAEGKRQAELILKAIAAYYPVPPRQYRVLETDPDIIGMQSHVDGSLWVRTSRGDFDAPEGRLAAFDVFDPEGHYKRQVEFRAPGDPAEDAVFLIGGDHVLVVTQALSAFRNMQGVGDESAAEEESAPMEVICYRMKG